jgi:radical SAM enzyme (TIGR01210 family)
MLPPTILPPGAGARSRWVLDRRGPRNRLDPWRPYGCFLEAELTERGHEEPVGTILLTNRECPFRCVMCDLWRNTLEETGSAGAIAAQIRWGREQLGEVRRLKLYNAGSFFDPSAIPPAEYPEIGAALAGCERVIVECHPRYVGSRVDALRASLASDVTLEVAIGLETAHPAVLDRLNKGMTLAGFRAAVARLTSAGVPVRAFLLVRPPWLTEAEGVEWACRSLEFAFDCGVETCVLIPTRAGNGAMDALQAAGEFTPPGLRSLEAAQEFGIRLARGRVLADLWDPPGDTCAECREARLRRLRTMNATQGLPPRVECAACA